LKIISIGDKWIAAGVNRDPKVTLLEDPMQTLERLRSGASGLIIQIFDATPVVSVRQIHAAAVATYLAFKAGTNISKKFEIEFLLRLAADTQINRAIKRLGVKPDSREVGFCIIGDDEEIVSKTAGYASQIIGGSDMSDEELRAEGRLEKAVEFYGISEAEIKSVQAPSKADAILLLILEHIATLDLKRR